MLSSATQGSRFTLRTRILMLARLLFSANGKADAKAERNKLPVSGKASNLVTPN
jgi:hypothetical protein